MHDISLYLLSKVCFRKASGSYLVGNEPSFSSSTWKSGGRVACDLDFFKINYKPQNIL